MNLLARAKSSTHLIFSISSLGRHPFSCRPITALQQCNFYATRATQQLTKPRTKKFSESSSSVPQLIKKQTDGQTAVWRRPSEMPFQAKVANFVNLMGHVKIPVQFECDSDGKHFAKTVISVGNEGKINSLLIPVVFEGDLAHIVACHVKENDCVFVAGQLSVDPKRLVLMENLGKFHIVAENLNFVEGFERSVLDKKIGVLKTTEKVDRVDNDIDSNQLSVETELAAFEHGNVADKGDAKSGVSVIKKKDIDHVWDLWRNLVNNPLQWWDYRKHKADGLLKENFPDFKQKESGEALWVRGAPKWVLYGLGKLVCDVEDIKRKQSQGVEKSSDHNQSGKLEDSSKNLEEKPQKWWGNRVGKGNPKGKLEDSWKDLVENPQKWWDNRVGKKNPKAPDFKHKETGEGLWLESSPAWALSELEKSVCDVKDIKPKQSQGFEKSSDHNQSGKLEDSWKDLVENSQKWWDNRVGKKNPKAPDFKHKETGEGLWLRNSPVWASSRLPPLKGDQNAIHADRFKTL